MRNAELLTLLSEGRIDMRVGDLMELYGTDQFANLTLDAANVRLGKGWKSEAPIWRAVSMTERLKDFRNQNIVRTGDFTTLPQVPQLAPYRDQNFTDEKAYYAPHKYGVLFSISLEMAAGDQLNALGNMVQRFGNAAARTLNKFVYYTNIDQNPTLVLDSTALFHANHSNDLGSSKALNTANLDAAIKLLMAQTSKGSTELGASAAADTNSLELVPRYILCGPANAAKAQRLIGSQNVNIYDTGSGVAAGGEPNLYSGLQVIVTSWLSSNSGNTWYVLADSGQVDMFRLGFLNGQETPEVFMEGRGTGHEFEYDAIRYKTRIVFGGCWADYRGIVRANV